jgi:cytochrome P450
VGIHLGRLEGRIGLETLLARLPDYDVDVDAVHWRQLVPTRPMDTLPATFAPARPAG